MKLLEDAFVKGGKTYTLVKRWKGVAMYSYRFEHSVKENFEVFWVASHNGFTIKGVECPPAESIPSDEKWGQKGWTFYDQESAYKKYAELLTEQIEKEKQQETK